MQDQHPNTAKLINLMATHGLSPQEVATMLNRKYRTVLQWRGARSQPIPDDALGLLEFKIQARSQKLEIA